MLIFLVLVYVTSRETNQLDRSHLRGLKVVVQVRTTRLWKTEKRTRATSDKSIKTKQSVKKTKQKTQKSIP